MRRLVQICAITAATVAATAPAAAARADNGLSANWAGFAVHKPGLSFQRVTGAWRQPSLSCQPGRRTYASMWVGLGGYYARPNALEQVGTDINCRKNGRVNSSAWFELVPGPTHTLRQPARPGDSMMGTVTAAGHTVRLVVSNLTRGWTFDQTVVAREVDVSSAEWILEAPSQCLSFDACAILPLAHFEHAAFSFASATTATGLTGPISSSAWDRSRITLSPGGRRYVAYRGVGRAGGAALPSRLAGGGTSFRFTYRRVTTTRFFSPAVVEAGYRQHPSLNCGAGSCLK